MIEELSPDASAITKFRQAQAAAAKLAGDDRRLAQKEIRKARGELVQLFSDLTLQRTFNSANARTEQLAWFWFNHFNVFWQKGLVGAALPNYVDGAIRPHVDGSFRELLLSVLSHPAMLVYLDNVSNVAGRGNENLARELLELHTLGVDGGYSQSDVREVARILTGMGLKPLMPGKRNPEGHPLARTNGEFLFNPYRHEGGPKHVLGRTIEGNGFAEIEALADLLVAHPATAHHLAGKLSRYLLGEAVTEKQQAYAANVFITTHGDLKATVDAIHETVGKSSEHAASFKDPYRYITTAVDLLRDRHPVKNATPIARWLSTLGQPLYGCRTPDGYSINGQDWLSAGQLAQRFELAQTMARKVGSLTEDPATAEAIWASPAIQACLIALQAQSRHIVQQPRQAGERLALLLSSPEFMYW